MCKLFLCFLARPSSAEPMQLRYFVHLWFEVASCYRRGVSKRLCPRAASAIKQQVGGGAENTIEIQLQKSKTTILLLNNYLVLLNAVTI